jgi:hypothetical protein
MHEAVTHLETMTRYWRQTERLKRISAFGTRRQLQEETRIRHQYEAKIRTALQDLNALEGLKRDLSAELP